MNALSVGAILCATILLIGCQPQTSQTKQPTTPQPNKTHETSGSSVQANTPSETKSTAHTNAQTSASQQSSEKPAVKPLFTRIAALKKPERYEPSIKKLCDEIGNKLGSVDVADCNAMKMQASGIDSVKGRPLAIREYLPEEEHIGRVLVIGGIHGDEYSSVSIVFKWMKQLEEQRDGRLHWRFIPLANPDGLLRSRSQRANANGVDLNRNFPTSDWEALALKYWKEKTHQNKRRYPGNAAASEPETSGLIQQIQTFKPDIIVSIHAPYHLVDYDGPSSAPKKIGVLHLHELGVFPGSLGNYGGLDLQLPVVTLELPHAGIMPSAQQTSEMWTDLKRWLIKERLRVVKNRQEKRSATEPELALE